MNEELKLQMKDIILERYGVDICDAKCYFSTQNYAFIFPDKPFMIRISISSQKTRSEIMSELMWLDDLNQFKKTVCEPTPSKLGNLLEEFELDGKTFRATMIRTARGTVKLTTEFKTKFWKKREFRYSFNLSASGKL